MNWLRNFFSSLGILKAGHGGTGNATNTIHGVMLGNAANALNATAAGATNTVLHGNTGADPTYSAVDLAADVTGTLPVANGGNRRTVKIKATDQTNATTTYADDATITFNVTNGKRYAFEFFFVLSNSTAADGFKLKMTGTLSASAAFFGVSTVLSASGFEQVVLCVGGTNVGQATLLATNKRVVQITGSFICDGTGTFLIQHAKDSNTTGTLTIYAGSWGAVEEIP